MIRDKRVAVAYLVEAIRLFDHYHFRIASADAKTAKKPIVLKKPPRIEGEVAWWDRDYRDAVRIRDRELFA